MLTLTIMAVGGVTDLAAWRLVAARRLSVWVAMGIASGGAGLAALATGRLALSPRLAVPWAVLWGIASGLALYGVTVAFVLVVRRWPVFERHVEEIYGQRKGLSLLPAHPDLAGANVELPRAPSRASSAPSRSSPRPARTPPASTSVSSCCTWRVGRSGTRC